jgi:hypothetical protein
MHGRHSSRYDSVMCKSFLIALVVTVLAFAAPCSARAGTVFGDCPHHPEACRSIRSTAA